MVEYRAKYYDFSQLLSLAHVAVPDWEGSKYAHSVIARSRCGSWQRCFSVLACIDPTKLLVIKVGIGLQTLGMPKRLHRPSIS